MRAALLVFAIVAVVAVASAASSNRGRPELDNAWKDYKQRHGKKYNGDADENTRRLRWEQVHDRVQQHNAEAAQGKHSYTMAENELSDNTEAELEALNGARLPPKARDEDAAFFEDYAEFRQTPPSSMDYRNHTCMPAVKNQGQCGSCWAFSATTPVEFLTCMKTKVKTVLSEQQLLNCSSAYGNGACDGGFYTNAWSYVKAAPGQALLSTHPYRAVNGTCRYVSTQRAANVTGYVSIPARNVSLILQAVGLKGPVSAAIQVVSSFQSYSSGIYSETACPSDGQTINHAVVIAGYGTLNGVPYWIVRNSWGATWGNKGYILMKRGVNQCNIESWVRYPAI